METVERDFSPKGVKFYYIYKALAHPETNGYITPFTQEERLMHVAEAKKKLGSRINWLCDTMTNDAKHALGDAPNSEFVIDPEGKVVISRRWSRPNELRADLEELVGEVEKPTTIADIGMKPLAPPKTAPKGIVPRLEVPGRMTPVRVEVASGAGLPALALPGSAVGEPLYVKLRAELDSSYASEGSGQLYLGFFLDPLYKVHWNNEVAPVVYSVEVPEGLEVSPAKGEGPKVDEKADADPREFLLEVSGESDDPIKVTVKYFACDDAETFCKPVTQQYLVSLERDRDGGSRRSSGRRPAGLAGGPRPGFGDSPLGSPSRERTAADEQRSRMLKKAVAVFRSHDADRDGRLNADEFAAFDKAPADADANDDGFVSLRELLDALGRAPVRSKEPPSRDGTNDALLAIIDLDGDGVLTTEELVQAGASLRKLDRNKDGEISADELKSAVRTVSDRAARPGSGGGRPDPREMLARMDRNGDGKITKDEVPQQMQRRWDRMDRDGNGFLDKDEQALVADRIRQSTGGQRPPRSSSD